MALTPDQAQDVATYFEVEGADVIVWHDALQQPAGVDREAVLAAMDRLMAVLDHHQMIMLSRMLDPITGPRPHV